MEVWDDNYNEKGVDIELRKLGSIKVSLKFSRCTREREISIIKSIQKIAKKYNVDLKVL
jgi:hypothetical protein